MKNVTKKIFLLLKKTFNIVRTIKLTENNSGYTSAMKRML